MNAYEALVRRRDGHETIVRVAASTGAEAKDQVEADLDNSYKYEVVEVKQTRG